ncbi:MAG: hypothetical protein AAF092_09945 [Pseudomonadota bacterium]
MVAAGLNRRWTGVALRTVFAVAALSLTAACPARMAVNAAGNVAGAAIKTTGAVVGGTVKVLTFQEGGVR